MWLKQESKARTVLECTTLGTGTLAIVALTVALLLLIHTVNGVVAQVPADINGVKAAAVAEIVATRHDLDAQLDLTRAQVLGAVNEQGTALRTDAKAELDAYRLTADSRLAQALERANITLDALQPSLQNGARLSANLADITAHADEAAGILFRRDALPAQLLGVTAAAKVALGETAKTMRVVQDATPQVVADIRTAADESAKASEKTAEVATNLANATKPLPKWLRALLMVAPPLAGTVEGVMGALSATVFFSK